MFSISTASGSNRDTWPTRRGFVAAAISVLVCGGGSLVRALDPLAAYAVDVKVDDEVSLFCGRMRVQAVAEMEGVLVCLGDIDDEAVWHHLLAGSVAWGMATTPSIASTMMCVGGDLETQTFKYVGGNAQIGGSVSGGNTVFGGGLGVGSAGSMQTDGLAIASEHYKPSNYQDFDRDWIIPGNEACRIRARMGRDAALVGRGNDGRSIDYRTYWDDVIAPAIKAMRGFDATGDIDIADCPIYTAEVQRAQRTYLTSSYDVTVTFTGDATERIQVFDLNVSDIEGALRRFGKQQMNFAFEGMPVDADFVVIIRIHGKNPTMRYGFKLMLEGEDIMTCVNAEETDPVFIKFRDLASRVMCLFDDEVGEVFIDCAHGDYNGRDTYQPGRVPFIYDELAGPRRRSACAGNLWCGSHIIPGDAYIKGSTNGKVFVSGLMTINTWEHHNVLWRGFDLIAPQPSPLPSTLVKEPMHDDWI